MLLNNGDTSERRFEIECKLESELGSLDALKEAAKQSKKLTNGMVAILSSLEDRLATLRRTILPVYNETGNLQSQQHSKFTKIQTKPIIITIYVLDKIETFNSICTIYRHRKNINNTRPCHRLLRSLPGSGRFGTRRTQRSRWPGRIPRGHESTVQCSALLREEQSQLGGVGECIDAL